MSGDQKSNEVQENGERQIAQILQDAKKIVFVTGAGISRESGIPTFRGKDGLWKKYDAMQLATIEAFENDPGLVWEWYQDRRKNVLEAKPNAAHSAIAQLGQKKQDVWVLTQNIDGLHKRAGSENVLELHGNIVRLKCTSCTLNQERTSHFPSLPPRCECGGLLRPDVVWFGEMLPQIEWSEAMKQASACDLMFIVGTSLLVSPANLLPIYAKQNGATLVEVNPERTKEHGSLMDYVIEEPSASALPRILCL